MSKIKTTYKVLMIFLFIQLVVVSVSATDCFEYIDGIQQDAEYDGSPPNEYFLKLTSQEIVDQNLNFVKKSPLPENCRNKKFVLWISEDVNFKITDKNTNITISGIDEVRFASKNGNPVTLDFFVNNDENKLTGIDPIPGVLDVNVNETRIVTKTTINMRERKRNALDFNGNTEHPKRVSHGVRLNFKDLIIEKDANLYISLIATIPENQKSFRYNERAKHGNHGGVAILSAKNITNNGIVDINLSAADGAKGGDGKIRSKEGGAGGNGGESVLLVEDGFIKNYGEFNVFLKSGNGGAGGNLLAGSFVANGGNGGNGGDINLSHMQDRIYKIINQGVLNFNLIAGDSGAGGTKSKMSNGEHGSSGVGGSVLDYNISEFVNSGVFNYYAIGGKVVINKHRGTGKAGSVGSINIDRLKNLTSDFNVVLELNEKNIENLTSVNCLCSDDIDCSKDDPSVGDINIKYLVSGSFLPKNLKIIKEVPVKETNINIDGCYAESSGNSEISYEADNLILRLSNLATIQYDFDSHSTRVGNIIVEETRCPVCDGLELNNFALRTDTEYTIFTDKDSNIIDLNIYYVNPDGNLFKPSGYPEDKNYVVYSLIPGLTIEPTQTQFIGTNIKEYKISKKILHYNPENFALNNIPVEKGYNIDDVRLFCQAQRYLLSFKLQDENVIKIPFTPLFDIK